MKWMGVPFHFLVVIRKPLCQVVDNQGLLPDILNTHHQSNAQTLQFPIIIAVATSCSQVQAIHALRVPPRSSISTQTQDFHKPKFSHPCILLSSLWPFSEATPHHQKPQLPPAHTVPYSVRPPLCTFSLYTPGARSPRWPVPNCTPRFRRSK